MGTSTYPRGGGGHQSDGGRTAPPSRKGEAEGRAMASQRSARELIVLHQTSVCWRSRARVRDQKVGWVDSWLSYASTMCPWEDLDSFSCWDVAMCSLWRPSVANLKFVLCVGLIGQTPSGWYTRGVLLKLPVAIRICFRDCHYIVTELLKYNLSCRLGFIRKFCHVINGSFQIEEVLEPISPPPNPEPSRKKQAEVKRWETMGVSGNVLCYSSKSCWKCLILLSR